jgi:hypothetical protein
MDKANRIEAIGLAVVEILKSEGIGFRLEDTAVDRFVFTLPDGFGVSIRDARGYGGSASIFPPRGRSGGGNHYLFENAIREASGARETKFDLDREPLPIAWQIFRKLIRGTEKARSIVSVRSEMDEAQIDRAEAGARDLAEIIGDTPHRGPSDPVPLSASAFTEKFSLRFQVQHGPDANRAVRMEMTVSQEMAERIVRLLASQE